MPFPLFIPPRSREIEFTFVILNSSSSIVTTVTSSYGWSTKRICISQLYSPFYSAMVKVHNCISAIKDNFKNVLVSIYNSLPTWNLHCRTTAKGCFWMFGRVADVLKTYISQRLCTVHWNVTGVALSKVIWALNSLAYLITTPINIKTLVPSDQECAMLGSTSDLPFNYPTCNNSHYESLSLHDIVFRVICGVGHGLSHACMYYIIIIYFSKNLLIDVIIYLLIMDIPSPQGNSDMPCTAAAH